MCLFKYLSGLKYEDSSPDYDYITDLLDTMSTFRTNAGVCAEDGTMQSPGNLAHRWRMPDTRQVPLLQWAAGSWEVILMSTRPFE